MNLDRRHFLGLAGVTAPAPRPWQPAAARPPAAPPPPAKPPTSTSAASSRPRRSTSGPTTPASRRTWRRPSSRSSTPSTRTSRSTWSPPAPTTRKSPRSSRPRRPPSPACPGVVVLSDVWWFRYFTNGSIIPVDGLIKELDIKLDDFRKSLVDDYKYDDKQWALPYGRSTPLFYYNKDHFAGRRPAGPGTDTWQEFGEWAPKLKATSGAQYAYIYPALAGYAGWTLQNNLWGWGGAGPRIGTSPAIHAEVGGGPAVGPGLDLQGQLGRRLLQGSRRRFLRRPDLLHDFLHRLAPGRAEIRHVQRRRRLPARAARRSRAASAPPAVPGWASPAASPRRNSSPPARS